MTIIPPENLIEIYKYLPQTNCKKCDKSTCMVFALELLKGNVIIEDCIPLVANSKYNKNYIELKGILGPEEGEKKELRINIDKDKCDGCGICVTACPVNARYCYSILSGKNPEYPPNKYQLFVIEEAKCELLNLECCRRIATEGRERECRVCETYCPRKAIKIEYV